MSTSLTASPVWAYLPAYLTLFVALGSACRALAHFITSPEVTFYLWATLIFHCLISFGLQCGPAAIRRWCARLRVLCIVFMPLMIVLLYQKVLVLLETELEINNLVTLLVGCTALLCIVFMGSRYGEQRVPIATPLVPALSLFGLLNSLSVDTIIQICFVIFVAASLYLVAYERVLARMLFHKPEIPALSGEESNNSGLSSRLGIGKAVIGRAALGHAAVGRVAAGYLLACVIWLGAFIGGAAIFYYPVEAILPRIVAAPLSAVRGTSAALLDWRSSSPVMELRGGNYPLSEREVMRVTARPLGQGPALIPNLWRGRIYENYQDSRWLETQDETTLDFRISRGMTTDIPSQIRAASADLAKPDAFSDFFLTPSPRLMRQFDIEAFVEPQRYNLQTLYFPGELVALRSSWVRLQVSASGAYRPNGGFGRFTPYLVQTRIREERSALQKARGLSPQELQQWRAQPHRARTLALDPDLKRQLAPIVAQIEQEAQSRGASLETPFAKAKAISDYLSRNCVYSLSSPLVPATEDAVMFFLTDSKQGACDMFASSMTLLLRAMDVPSRLAAGYLKPEEEEKPEGNSSGYEFIATRLRLAADNLKADERAVTFMLREREAHAWVEYYVPDTGWLSYDPTANTRTTEMPLDAQIATFINFPQLRFNWKTLWLPACGLVLVMAGLLWTAFDFQNRRSGEARRPSDQERARIERIYEQAVSLLTRRVPRRPQQTPLEYEAAVNRATVSAPAKQEFAALTYLLMAARYRRDIPATQIAELQSCLERLRHALRQ